MIGGHCDNTRILLPVDRRQRRRRFAVGRHLICSSLCAVAGRPDPNPDAAPNYPVLIVMCGQARGGRHALNVGPNPVDLDGWHRCSITGTQAHPSGGPLNPGEQRDYAGPSGQI
jgi:hypothetical protein